MVAVSYTHLCLPFPNNSPKNGTFHLRQNWIPYKVVNGIHQNRNETDTPQHKSRFAQPLVSVSFHFGEEKRREEIKENCERDEDDMRGSVIYVKRGGGGSDLKWGRDEDEVNRAWALRCMRMARRMMRPSIGKKPKC